MKGEAPRGFLGGVMALKNTDAGWGGTSEEEEKEGEAEGEKEGEEGGGVARLYAARLAERPEMMVRVGLGAERVREGSEAGVFLSA